MNPDYMHRNGWAPMKETLRKIKDEARKRRAEKSSERKSNKEEGGRVISPLFRT